MTHYRPYSDEWHRQRYLEEALDKYLDAYVDNEVILADIHEILQSRSNAAKAEYEKVTELDSKLRID
tara:strand:- start:470 stop:670 length:201 start_codon:yes stop_codon:yes gene_type:complete